MYLYQPSVRTQTYTDNSASFSTNYYPGKKKYMKLIFWRATQDCERTTANETVHLQYDSCASLQKGITRQETMGHV